MKAGSGERHRRGCADTRAHALPSEVPLFGTKEGRARPFAVRRHFRLHTSDFILLPSPFRLYTFRDLPVSALSAIVQGFLPAQLLPVLACPPKRQRRGLVVLGRQVARCSRRLPSPTRRAIRACEHKRLGVREGHPVADRLAGDGYRHHPGDHCETNAALLG